MSVEERVSAQVEEIREFRTALAKLAATFRVDPVTGAECQFEDRFSSDDWRRNVFGNAFVKLLQIVETNFNFIETIGLLGVTRYVFELSIWLRLIQSDSRFALIYYRELLSTQRKYYRDQVEHLNREVDLLKRFEERDRQESDRSIRDLLGKSDPGEISSAIREVRDRVDAEASRNFSMYFEQAKMNGYEFQAHLVQTQAIPAAEAALAEIEGSLSQFEASVPRDIQKLVKGRWQWRAMAERAGILDEYDFIYAYASKLAHASPASLTTNQKNLELEEVDMFLSYIRVKLLEMMELGYAQPESALKSVD